MIIPVSTALRIFSLSGNGHRIDERSHWRFSRGSSIPEDPCWNKGNDWIWSNDGWDLTHPVDPSLNLPENSVHLDCELINVKIHPPSAPSTNKAEGAILQYGIPAARKLGLQIIWLHWGLTEDDLASMPPN
ncbi:hypothetical protein N7530_009629 [Penicillium desertorum]|uniref:Uncharacterized protein n=1 Tax=Penicillium desertorum TaxID=1303715 RepID=A0A9W9WIT4_9EURO|nr:hypothetical protein N7530_009629 [Penicillium desertorum]